FEFDASGAFTTGEYLPNVDYNEQAPFDPTEVFSYIVEDFDVTRIPGSEIPDPDAIGSIDYTSTNNRSTPKQMTLTTRAVNDAPEFPTFSTVTFAEDVNADDAPVYYDLYDGVVVASGDLAAHRVDEEIFVSQDTALDERVDGVQELTFTYSVDAPQGMFSAEPVLDEYGILTLMPNPDVFGWAVIEITATDNGQSYIGGVMQDDFRSVTRTVTVNITPVNDAPVTFDRSLEVLEVEEFAAGTGDPTNVVATLVLTEDDFLGGTTANPERAEQSDFADDMDYDSSPGGVEYDEEEQGLRVVEFTVVDEFGNSVVVDKDRNNNVPITLSTGVITFVFDASGAFTTGEYLPNVDYNEQTPFDPTEVFSYIVEDFDVTRIPGSEIPDPDATGSIDYTSTNNRSAPKQMTLTTRAVNDAPRFDFNEGVFVLERDDLGQRNITDWASNILPSESTALDELATQGVRFELQTALSSIPAGLFAVPPTVSEDGTMRLTTSVDAVGTAELVFNVVDYSLSNDPGFVSKFVQVTTTVHVQPVNDAPRLDPSVVPTPEDTNASVDDRYHIESDGTLVITMTEDNQINGGGTYRIYLERDSSTERPGLLDLFVSGPSDEINGGQNVVGNPTTTAIAQSLQLTNFPATTTQGGTLVRGVEPGVDGREYLDYTPRSHQNIDTVGNDLFLYTVQDDGQTYTLGSTSFESGVLQSNPLSSMGRVRLVLNPVNDAPQFTIDPARVDGSGDVTVTVTEGAPAGVTFNLIADRAAGPATATDETDPVNGQTVTYHITPDPAVAYPGVFTTPPSVDALGRLTFAAGTEISGDFVFSIFAMDNGANDPIGRGDVNTSAATAFTISITPVNDPPEVKAGEDGIVSDTIAEEGSTTITEAELLAEFQGGPTAPAGSGAIDESTQGLVIFSGLPTDGGPAVTTTGGGTITRTGSTFTYTPALNFAGVDTVVYQISDTATPDSPNVPGTWLINVTPVNDAPDLGSLDLMVGLPEDIGAVRIDDWFAGVTVGPAGDSSGAGRANDEIDGLGTIPAQTFASITIRPVATDDRYRDLFQFTDGDLDSVVRLEGNTLVFDVLPGASGMATFDVIVTDDGSNDAPNVAVASTRLTITIDSSNDVPSFDVVGDNPIAVVEGDPLYIANWADNVSAGDTGQTSRFIVNVPAGDEDLFEVLPTIDATGEISFQFKEDANGSTVLGISLTDDADPNDGQLLTSDGLPALTSPEVLLTISITPVNDAPIANDNDFTTTEDNLLTFTVNDLLGNDTDIDVGDSLTLVQTGTLITELGATVNINSTGGLITYNPLGASEIQKLRPGTSVVDSFQYQVSDSEGELSNFATVRLTISGANDAPILGDDVIGFTYEENASGAPIAKSVTIPGNSIFDNDFDIDEGETIQPLTFTVTIQPQYGELRQDAVTGEVTYLPGANFLTEGNRQDSFEYTLNDAGGIVSGQPSAPATVHIVTRPTPTVDPIRTGTFNNASGTGTAVVDLDDLFVSVDGLDLAKTVIKINGQNGVAVINAAGQLVYTPNPGHTGEDTVTIEVEDVNGVKSGDVIVQFNTTNNERTNPSEPTDVNRNGFVTALDALMIINLLNSGLGGTSGGIPISAIPAGDDSYYDVNDDGFVTEVDALRVINALNAQDAGLAGGEPIAPQALGADDAVAATTGVAATVSSVESGGSKVVGGAEFDGESDLLELIAIDAAGGGSDSDGDGSLEANLDAAIADLF
ncbi:tandem-95 repeat protein, partial [Rhodopirellula sp. SWK7]|uniref:tandem-95 repeat protein n=1 Tax=Rhodopirellula sp. SWK7 TaxID=595460 RepID=UPI001F367F85